MMTTNKPTGNLKKSIRDTTRFLSRPNLPADVRREMERKLAALQVALGDKSKAELERKMTLKYRMVKFFERKKALRRLASAQASGNDEAVKQAQLDLAYILHYPKDRKYISLYAKNPACEAVAAQQAAIRKEIADKLALLGAETMLSKVLKAKAADLHDGAESDEDDEEFDSEDEEDFDSEDDEEDSEDDEDDEDEEDDEDDESGDEDDFDSEDEDDFDSDEDDDDEDDFDSEDEDSEDEDSDDDEEDFDSEDDEEEDSEEDDDDEEDDFDSEEEEESDEEEPAAKRRK